MLRAPSLWHPGTSRSTNIYVIFQSELAIKSAGDVILKIFGYSMYRVYLDGIEIAEGPARYAPDHPEYDQHSVRLTGHSHILTVIVHDYGVHTRILIGGIAPFLQCVVEGADGEIALEWKCRELDAYEFSDRRLNPQLGWPELCDTRKLPNLTHLYDGADWVKPMEIPHPLGDHPVVPKTIGDVLRLPVQSTVIAQGLYADRFGYVNDDLPVRFISRDLKPSLPEDGFWIRYDFGKIGLHRPAIQLDAPEGVVIEAGYGESLTEGRVYPVITLSAGASCHMDRWITRGGVQELKTFSPRGFRYLELHVAAPANKITIESVMAIQRTAYEISKGTFTCSDPLLNRIWSVGVDTLRACCEDALTDTPTRERGQWIGDAAVIGMEVLAVSFGDLSLIRRSLLQASYRRREDGLAAGLCPGQEAYLTSFALYWINGCLRYSRLTGDHTLLEQVYETAVGTLNIFWAGMTQRGVLVADAWDFLDWGHSIPDNELNVSLNLLLLKTLKDMLEWERLLSNDTGVELRREQINILSDIINKFYITPSGLPVKSVPQEGILAANERKPGYHATVLALLFGLLEEGEVREHAVSFVKDHMLNCFPNDPNAPRLANPSANSDRLITPSFAHFALQALWEAGEVDFVLNQYRICWGWMLDEGATTLLEVFDTRWSHCHAWSGSPTWQLSRHLLGLIPLPEDASGCYLLDFQPGSLAQASGKVPLLHKQGLVEISWQRVSEGQWIYNLKTNQPIHIRLSNRSKPKELIIDSVNKPHAIGEEPFEVLQGIKLMYS
ncbi:family 78 glycoside hydrolase catalytic domain [Cohnella silvisoli]|uniref:Alpha-L-rhamnosidase six-hairpin glycosidase domain-containing protein n=1 Tax=Cohnella silvisoli TaxID=2873699 RepID=A0ABV1KTH5_9BACL|nr:hypothetical protein [Cohnella silvisoli]MCD9022920.1 hypothetical protein [Cohnella silvisoli]